MDAKDLMLGDWIGWLPTWKNDETGEIEWDGDRNEPIIGKVGMLMKDCTTIDYCDESVEVEDIGLIPIPLTAEILGKNKFSKSRLMGEQRHFTYYLAPSVSLLAIYDADFSLCIGDCARYIKYVHQLQHVLRLCGIEKEIEL